MVPIGQAISEEKIFKTFSHRYSYVKTMSADVGCFGWQVGSSDTILEVNHLRTILPKFGANRPSSFRDEDF